MQSILANRHRRSQMTSEFFTHFLSNHLVSFWSMRCVENVVLDGPSHIIRKFNFTITGLLDFETNNKAYISRWPSSGSKPDKLGCTQVPRGRPPDGAQATPCRGVRRWSLLPAPLPVIDVFACCVLTRD